MFVRTKVVGTWSKGSVPETSQDSLQTMNKYGFVWGMAEQYLDNSNTNFNLLLTSECDSDSKDVFTNKWYLQLNPMCCYIDKHFEESQTTAAKK